MRDSHVEALYFQISSGPGTRYVEPGRLSFSGPLGDFTTDGGVLKVVPAEHFVSEREARGAIEPFLRAWRLRQTFGQPMVQFASISSVPKSWTDLRLAQVKASSGLR